MDAVFFAFFIPGVILTLLFSNAYIRYTRLYRKKKNPNYPLPRESSGFIIKNPIEFIKILPILPVLWWKIVFESHKDQELDQSAKRTRKMLWTFVGFMFVNFLFHVVLSVFDVI